MKPRPTISTLATAVRPQTTLQCRRNIHTRAIAPGLGCQVWHDNFFRRVESQKPCPAHSYRHASTSTQPPPKPVYNRAAPAKTPKPTVPAKTSPSSPPRTVPKTDTTPQLPGLKHNSSLNPPDSTYAPELNLPTRAPDQSFISHLWKCGRTYLTFYKTGVSNVRSTSTLARSLRARAGPTGTVDYTQALTRAEWQIVRRSRLDMLRLPAFGVIFLVFGEWTPLLVKWLTPIIPEACRIPSQIMRLDEKVEKRRGDRLHRLDTRNPGDAARGLDVKNVGARSLSRLDVHDLSVRDAHVLAARFDAYSAVWDWVSVTPPKQMLIRNLRKTIEYLKKDDELIVRDGGCQGLEKREVERACRERGIDVLGKKEEELRRGLLRWFEDRGK